MKNSDMPINGCFMKAGESAVQEGGLTKREYFAGLALQGILAARSNMALEDFEVAMITGDALEAADSLLSDLEE